MKALGDFQANSRKVRLAGRLGTTTRRDRGRNAERQPLASGTKRPVGPEFRTLFESGTVSGRSDGELLDRFLAGGGPVAEAAFAALIERHGPMVWRVCRDVLRESSDADDAFQATFLVLARRAGVIRKRSSLGSWLFGVALRVACCARMRAARRRNREMVAAQQEREEFVLDVDRLDAAPILHEEVGRLPPKYRSPLVLCYFEGLTHDQAASQLGWPVGTVRSRLSEARDRLRPRLLLRGVAPTVAVLAATGRVQASATVPAALVSATVGMAVGEGAAGTFPAAVAALVGTALREMTLMKLRVIATGLVAAALVGTAGVGLVAARPQNAGQDDTPKPNAQSGSPKANEPAAQADAPKANEPAAKANEENSNPTGIVPGRDRRSPAVTNLQPRGNSPRVVWAQLSAAASKLQLATAAHQAARGTYDQVVAVRGEVDAFAAELNTCADDLRDEVDLLQAQLEIRKADVQAAEAQRAKAALSHTNVEKLAEKKAVSQLEVRGSEYDLDIRSAELAKKKAELNEVVLRIKQATRRRDEAIELANRANGLIPEPEAPLKPAAPPAKR
jgi:RNA polymerase sigma factor (sigma-70 family)